MLLVGDGVQDVPCVLDGFLPSAEGPSPTSVRGCEMGIVEERSELIVVGFGVLNPWSYSRGVSKPICTLARSIMEYKRA